MATSACLLVVADYPFIEVGSAVYAEIPWDEALATLYAPRFARIMLLGRRRRAGHPPTGWMPVDPAHFEVLEAGDWNGPLGFLANLPRLIGSLSAVWSRVSVVYLKLFYLTSVAVWYYNRWRGPGGKRPVVTLLVGDAADAVLLRNDLIPFAWLRALAARAVSGLIRSIQAGADVAGWWARFLADKFLPDGPRNLVVNEPWLRQGQIRRHDRTAPRTPATILFVGRLVARKRAHLLLEAISRLQREGRDLRTVIVGDGPERAGLEALARDLGIGSAVRFTGWLGVLSVEMLAAYDAADIFCLPSFAEGLPLVVIEAMGRGAAVVATAVSGTPEAVQHEQTGLLVPRDDAEALTVAVRRYLTDPGLWLRCVEGGYTVAERFTFERERRRLAEATVALAP